MHHLREFHFEVYAQALRRPLVDFYQQKSPQTLEIYNRANFSSQSLRTLSLEAKENKIPRDAIFSQLLESIDDDRSDGWRILSLFVIQS